ncbi:MAG: hypothetical protein CV088_09345 [Nitrospira sp. LK70]|nr:hypothetical protein [Nitrospira sp. LK70]
MREQLQRRLETLKKEFHAGRARATELEQQQTNLHQTLLRISGAIQVLEEELSPAKAHNTNGERASESKEAGVVA